MKTFLLSMSASKILKITNENSSVSFLKLVLPGDNLRTVYSSFVSLTVQADPGIILKSYFITDHKYYHLQQELPGAIFKTIMLLL